MNASFDPKNRQSRPNIARIFYDLSPSEKSPENRLATSQKFLRHGQVQYRRFGAKSPELATLQLFYHFDHKLHENLYVYGSDD